MGTTIFAEMSALAVTTGAVNLGQGFPDVDGPKEIAEAAVAAIRAGRGNQYPPGAGVPELRQAIAAHQKRFYGFDLDPDSQVLVTVGATEAIAAALLALLEPGDEAIAFEPYYDSYAASVAMAGATRVPVTLRPPDFRPDLDALRAAITPRTRMILLNSPHNPTGVVFTPDELGRLAELACEHDLLVVSDEVYEHMVFDGTHLPIASLPGMAGRTVTISSAAKTFSFTGWKVGWVTGSPEIVSAVRTVKQFLTYVSSGPFQYAIAQALALPSVDTWVGVIPLGYGDGVQFCKELPHRAGVVAIPSSVFYDNVEAAQSQVRFAFCKKQEVLAEALARLEAVRPAGR